MMVGRQTVAPTGFWFMAAGASTLVRAAIELTEPVYYAPSSLVDYAAVVLTSVMSGALAVAFYSWWRAAPFSWLSIILPVAAIGIAVESLGNLLEDGFNSELGATMYNYGGLVGAVALLVTAVVALASGASLRWSGLFLMAALGGAIVPNEAGLSLTGASFLGLGFWMNRLRAEERVCDNETP